MDTEKLEIEVEPLVFTERPRILAQVAIFFALLAAVTYGVVTFWVPQSAPPTDNRKETLTEIVTVFIIAALSLVLAVYIFKTM